MDNLPKISKFDVNTIFYDLQNVNYCIVKLSPAFPRCVKGSDLDIFCYDIKHFAEVLINMYKKHCADEMLEIDFREVMVDHWHIDFIENSKIEIRFDLYGRLPSYKNLKIMPALFESIVENSVSKIIDSEDMSYKIYIPSIVDDMIIRYIEYIEFYKSGPDKIHHMKYIESNISKNGLRQKFFEKLHHYTDFPEIDSGDRSTNWKTENNKFKNDLDFKKYAYELFDTPINEVPFKILKGFKRILDSIK